MIEMPRPKRRGRQILERVVAVLAGMQFLDVLAADAGEDYWFLVTRAKSDPKVATLLEQEGLVRPRRLTEYDLWR